MTDAIARIDAFLDGHEAGAPGRLRRLPAHPEHRDAVASIDATGRPRPSSSRERLERGASSTSRLPRPGAPDGLRRLVARRGAPTVLVYGHYDVQPVDPLDLWVRPPFEPRVEDGGLRPGRRGRQGPDPSPPVGRPCLAGDEGRLPINIRYVFEGEEESGSTNFDTWLEANRHRSARTSRSSATRGSSRATTRRSRSACGA